MLFFQVKIRKQRTAFPPNFVHSLDGSHMMMTAVACRDAGLHFAGFSFQSALETVKSFNAFDEQADTKKNCFPRKN